MSRHKAIEEVGCCASASTVAIDWTQFVSSTTTSIDPLSPLDAFYQAHVGLIKLSALVGTKHVDSDASTLLAGQVTLGYVSATELFLRQSVARMARVCPFVRNANRDQSIPFGAIDYYDKHSIEDALTERVSFSETGAVKKQLESRLALKVASGTSLAQSIRDFERLCQLRHALVHSHGVVNSANASLLLDEPSSKPKVVTLDAQCLQWAASVAVNLTRDVTQELLRSTLWRWIQERYLTGDGRTDRPRIAKLVKALGSTTDAAQGRVVLSVVNVGVNVRAAIDDLHT